MKNQVNRGDRTGAYGREIRLSPERHLRLEFCQLVEMGVVVGEIESVDLRTREDQKVGKRRVTPDARPRSASRIARAHTSEDIS